jgi:hypothetical protein
VKMAIQPKAIYMFNAIPIKSLSKFLSNVLHRNRKSNHEVHMGTQKTSNSQSNSEQKSNTGGITILDLKLYCRVITIKTACYGHKKK